MLRDIYYPWKGCLRAAANRRRTRPSPAAIRTGAGPLRSVAVKARQLVSTAADGLASYQWSRRPDTISVEITAICDARCIHCPRHNMKRAQRPMDLALFKRLIDEAAELRVPRISPNGYGELLTLRNLEAYLAYIRSKPHRFEIVVNTNGYRMDEEKWRLFLDYEIDLLMVTLDGATAQTFEAIRGELSLAQIEGNVHALLVERRRRGATLPKVLINIVEIPQNAHEVDLVLDKWRGVADSVNASRFTNRAGSLAQNLVLKKSLGAVDQRAYACALPFNHLSIWADGRAVLCCDDWNAEHVVGDLNVSTLRDVWHGAGLRHARQMHSDGKGDTLAICSRCSYWREPNRVGFAMQLAQLVEPLTRRRTPSPRPRGTASSG